MGKPQQSFVIAEECRKAAWEHGYRRAVGNRNGWYRYGSTTAKGTIHLAGAGDSGPWFLALDHVGVIQELNQPTADFAGPGIARYAFSEIGKLYPVLMKVYALGCALPDAPLEEFRSRIRGLPRKTEAERLHVERIGQDVFRGSLMTYWQERCPLTGIGDRALLRASHIIPWRECSDDERLNVHNGLLLSALWDAAFDKGLVTFDDDGHPTFSSALSDEAQSQLRWHDPIPLTDNHRERLVWHRRNLFDESLQNPGAFDGDSGGI